MKHNPIKYIKNKPIKSAIAGITLLLGAGTAGSIYIDNKIEESFSNLQNIIGLTGTLTQDNMGNIEPAGKLYEIPKDITNLETGKYKYTAAAISSVGTFFDKVILVPDPGLQVRNFINPFYIRLQNYVGEVPESHEKCRVFLKTVVD